MSSSPQPSSSVRATGAAAPSTPITPRAKANLHPVLNNLAGVIVTSDDDTPANKIRYSMEFLTKAAARLNVDLTPIPQPIFEPPATRSQPGSPAKPDLGTSVETFFDQYNIPSRPSLAESMAAIINKHNPSGKQLSTSPPSEAFAAVGARATRAATAATSAAAAAGPVAPAPAPQMALRQDFLSAQVQALRLAFENTLAQAEFSWTRNNKTTMTKFTALEVTSTSKLIFDDVFNTTGFLRAVQIIRSYRGQQQGPTPISATLIAERLSLDAKLPSDLREFFSVYSSCTKSLNQKSAVESMIMLHEKYKLYNSYVRIISQPSNALQALLTDAGLVPEQGRGWSSVTLQYIGNTLDLSKNKLSNILQETQAVYLLVSTFGVGVLAFVPSRIRQFLSRMGTQKCEQVFKVAEQVGLLEAVTPVCNRARRTIVNPVLHGLNPAPLQLDPPNYKAQSLIEAVSVVGEEDDMDTEMEDPQEFKPIESSDDDQIMTDKEVEWTGFDDQVKDLEVEQSGNELEDSDNEPAQSAKPKNPDYELLESDESEDPDYEPPESVESPEESDESEGQGDES